MTNSAAASRTPRPPLSLQFDAIVVGAGAAGLYSALCLPSSLRVGLLTKDDLPLSASDWAQGGIAAAIAPDDSPKLHVEDTLKAGAGLCDEAAVRFLAEQAPACVRSLVTLGVAFDRHRDDLALTLEAAHSRRRVLHAADTTGRAVVSTLSRQVAGRDNITALSNAFVLDLWLDESGCCRGVCVLYEEKIAWVQARAVVLATGGGGQVFAKTTNPSVSTGDGVAIAARAGALLRDLEFVQFHPTALTLPDAPRFLISEAVRGEGAHLVNDAGRRFAFDYHPDGELAPRDVVSRAIFSYLQSTGADPADSHVWLDCRPIAPEQLQRRFPNILRVCRDWGIDPAQEPIPVAPAAHYWMGGIATDLQGRTSIPGLYAVGETASTGVHGANRLASNSLLECLVFGAQLAELELLSPASGTATPHVKTLPLEISLASETLEEIRHDLPRLLWKSAGICREAASLQEAIAQVQQWKQLEAEFPLAQQMQHLRPMQGYCLSSGAATWLLEWGELRNLLEVAELILKSAAFRCESRGGHYRSDFPQMRSQWTGHTLIHGERLWCGEGPGNLLDWG
ncbi:MAG: L-aspartate oxidase [Phormidium sp. BM_Day4_Bin.17]|nr:L-aspartate oxidase [Phormidium sp. BM_Day4_Bin.17]UCJ12211.1 MAG: L-aspartate oxidase [Phormidium sp. PBR-2020]